MYYCILFIYQRMQLYIIHVHVLMHSFKCKDFLYAHMPFQNPGYRGICQAMYALVLYIGTWSTKSLLTLCTYIKLSTRKHINET